MSCMCGDLYCRSCGPAQGNYRCDACGAWSMDGGCVKPEDCAETQRQMAEAEQRQYEEEQSYYAEMKARAREGEGQ
jgi:hypothetical protein